MNKALTTTGPAPAGRPTLKKTTLTTKTTSNTPLTISFTGKAVSSAPSSSLSPSSAASVARAARTPTSPVPFSFSSLTPIQKRTLVTHPPSLPAQHQKEQPRRFRTKTNASVCAQTRGTIVSNPATNPSHLPSDPSISCPSSSSPVPSIRSTAATLLSAPSSRVQLRQQKGPPPPQQKTSSLARARQPQVQQYPAVLKQRQRIQTMTWLDRTSTKPEEQAILAVESKKSNWSLPMSPLSPLPKVIVEEELDQDDPITGYDSSNQLEDDDEYSLYQEDEEYEDEQEGEDVKTLVLNGTGEGTTEVMSWLQEAIQTVNLLESRVQELEQDCSSIPLYEQDRIQMSEVIQGLDEMVVQDRQWIEYTEGAVQWAAHVLEETLLGSFPPPQQSNGPASLSASVRTSNSRSEGVLPNLVASRSLSEAATGSITTPFDSQEGTEQKMTKRRGTLNNEETMTATTSPVLSAEAERYRDGIQAALRHLRTIEHSHTRSSCGSSNDGQHPVNESVQRRSIVPDMAMKTWLENASATSLTSDSAVMQVDDSQLDLNFDDDEEEEEEKDECEQDERRDSINKATRLTTSKATLLSSPSLPPQKLNPASEELLQSSISLQATLSGSSQSIMANADLGDPCLVDERIYLKQHVQGLDRLRLQELERHQSVEAGYGQLVRDLNRFSNEMLQAVNTLTVAQAALDGANELSLHTLRMVEKDEEEESGSQSSVLEGKTNQSLLSRTPSHRQRKGSMIQSSCRELTESVGLVELEIRKMRRLAADCVGITELAHGCLIVSNDNATAALRAGPCTGIITASESTSSPHPPPAQPQPRLSLSLSTSAVQPPPPNQSLFVDGVSLQEFEAHLAAVRSTNETTSSANSIITPFMKRVLVEDIQPCLLVSPSSSASNHHRSASRASASSGRWISSLLGSNQHSDLHNPTMLFPKLLKAMEKNACEIQMLNGSAKSSMPSSTGVASSNSSSQRCCLCGIERPCEFRIRILEDRMTSDVVVPSSSTSLSTLQIGSRAFKSASANAHSNNSTGNGHSSHSYPLDRFCRDRVVAVCDFYMFLAHLRQGLLNHQPSLELFRRALVLRQRMGQARIGSMDIVASAAVSASTSDVTTQ